MTSDEDAVRTLLRESDIPPTRLDVAGLMAGSRRSRRRHRFAVVAGAVLAVGAVAVPTAVVATRVTGPGRPAGGFATTTRVVHRTTTADAPVRCGATPFRQPVAGSYAVVDVDATGRQVVGARQGGTTMTLWTGGEPTQFDWSDMRAVEASVGAVSSGGTVVGFGPGDPAISYIYRDGVVRTLARPAGYRQAQVVDVNDRGDAVGTLSSPQAYGDERALVVWPAGRPDRPRVVPEPNLRPLTIRDDGTVIALRIRGDHLSEQRGDAVVVHRPDGTRLQLDAPPGITGTGSLTRAVVHGDLLFTTYVSGEYLEPDPQQPDPRPVPVDRPVRWNLRTGLVEIFDDLSRASSPGVGNARGWFLAGRGDEGWPQVVVAPDGSARELPVTQVSWIGADGSAFIGSAVDGNAVTWRCAG
jgi:hypothetical protein